MSDERYKGMDTLISVLPRLLHEWPVLQLVLIGEGDDQIWLEQIADEQCGVRKRVTFLSGLRYAQVAACYSACEIFALPSRGEGFGLVYLEAMARGKPVIGGAHGGAPEVIDDGKTGYLVQHGEARNWRHPSDLAEGSSFGREMGKRGRSESTGVQVRCFRQVAEEKFFANYANPERHTDLRPLLWNSVVHL